MGRYTLNSPIELTVDRSTREYAVSTAGWAYFDPEAMRDHHIVEGDVLRVVTYFGKSAVVRVAAPLNPDAGYQTVHLDRFQRQSLGVRLGERVTFYPIELPNLSQIVLLPSVDMTTAMTHHLEEHLHEQMVEDRAPVMAGMILFAHFHHSVAGTTYRVLSTDPDVGIVGPDTTVMLEPAKEGPGESGALSVSFDDIGGMGPHLEIIREMVQLPLLQPAVYRQMGIRPPRGILFYGPPGTGKTLLARAMANELHAAFYYINGPAIVGSMYGETEGNLRKIFGEATHHAPSVILIDELDVLAPKRGETGAHSDTRVVTQLLSLLDGIDKVEGVVVVATTNRIHAIDDALRRPGRFDRELYFGPPDRVGREDILAIHTRDMPLSPRAKAYLSELAEVSAGYVGADLRELCREAGIQALRRYISPTHNWGIHIQVPEDIQVEPEDFYASQKKVRPSSSRLVMTRSTTRSFSDIGGYHSLKERLTDLIIEPLLNPILRQELESLGIEGVVLHGPSGTGKTLLATAVAKEAGANLVVVDGPELFTKWLGQSEEAVRQMFDLARRLSPTLLFFDQLDALAPRRSLDSGSRTTERVISQLLAELDDLQDHPTAVAVMAATSRLDMVDPAVVRAGRLGRHILVNMPNVHDRYEILALQLRPLQVLTTDNDPLLTDLANATEGKSGADLMGMCREVRRELLREAHHAKNLRGPDGSATNVALDILLKTFSVS